mgnify:CR=1 FL=1|jgi:hypothetical protein|tara:strand:+ start:57 stop:413 length:357 start_codon:yes stop_codon:yes gene_type:complete
MELVEGVRVVICRSQQTSDASGAAPRSYRLGWEGSIANEVTPATRIVDVRFDDATTKSFQTDRLMVVDLEHDVVSSGRTVVFRPQRIMVGRQSRHAAATSDLSGCIGACPSSLMLRRV